MSIAFLKEAGEGFPLVVVVPASAGAGKTYALIHRIVQLLLGERIPHRSLRSLLAITFTNNAATDMRRRVVELLKKISLGDADSTEEAADSTGIPAERLAAKASQLLDTILLDYSEFQIRTIDSFVSSLFKSSALEFGFRPDIEIALSDDRLFRLAFEEFARELQRDPVRRDLLVHLSDLVLEQRKGSDAFLWDPFRRIRNEVKRIHEAVTAYAAPLASVDLAPELRSVRDELRQSALRLQEILANSGLPSNSNMARDLDDLAHGNVTTVAGRSIKARAFNNPKNEDQRRSEERLGETITSAHEALNELLRRSITLAARHHFEPYVRALALVQSTLDRIARRQGSIAISDVNRRMALHLVEASIPEVYVKLGETIYHHLIDEFQDTSPLQWENLKPLIEESLSKGGSLFVVGDTKQSIYGFRNADWRIMRGLETENPFPSARHLVRPLDTNHRSAERIVRFNEEVFREIIPLRVPGDAVAASGLGTFHQEVEPSKLGKGYVEVCRLPINEPGNPEKSKLVDIVRELSQRGFAWRDIAILTPTNKSVVEVSGWLNEADVPFISHSSLDVRRRGVVGEILALLRFLDSPIDDHSFACFIRGKLAEAAFGTSSAAERVDAFLLEHADGPIPLYAAYRSAFHSVWETHFERLLNVVGYLPLYDLVAETLKVFSVFEFFPGEEAAVTKFLEVVLGFEQEGVNTLRSFLEFTAEEENGGSWEVDVPKSLDAVQVMTVHKAKGLGFRATLVLLYDGTPKVESLHLVETEEGVELLKITKDSAEKVPELKAVADRDRFEQFVDSLNKLYVAFTRAESELYVIAVCDSPAGVPSSYLPTTGYDPSTKPDVEHVNATIQKSQQFRHETLARAIPVQPMEPAGVMETLRGEVVHETFSRIEFAEDLTTGRLAEILERALARRRAPWRIDDLQPLIERALRNEGLRKYFERSGDRVIRNEMELVRSDGALFRADRVVVDTERVTVIDYKTGHESEAHLQQIENYLRMLAAIYPGRTAMGLLAYVDLNTTRSVSWAG